MPGKPLIFGNKSPSEKASEGGWDPYLEPDTIPGYSEIVKARDIAKAEYINSGKFTIGLTESDKRDYYKRFGTEPKDTKVEFRWLRITGPDGANDYKADTQLMRAQYEGWDLVNVSSKEDFEEKFGFTFPPAARLAPDGTVRRMDVALAVIPGEVARRNEKARQLRADRLMAEETEARQGPQTGMDVSVSLEGEGSREVSYQPNV